MNIKEFRTLTGQEVTENEFEDINKLYMATGNMDKQTFCGLWKKDDLFRIALEVERNLSAKVTFGEKVLANKEQELDDMANQQAAERENMSHAADVLLAVDEAGDTPRSGGAQSSHGFATERGRQKVYFEPFKQVKIWKQQESKSR